MALLNKDTVIAEAQIYYDETLEEAIKSELYLGKERLDLWNTVHRLYMGFQALAMNDILTVTQEQEVLGKLQYLIKTNVS